METLIGWRNSYLAKMFAGDSFFLQNKVHLDLSGIAQVEAQSTGGEIVTFTRSIYLAIGQYNSTRKIVKDIYHVREIEPELPVHFRQATIDRQAQKAYHYLEIEPITINPRFHWLILYPNEIGIGDYNDTGNKGWITTSSDVRIAIGKLPPPYKSGISNKMWIVYHDEDKKQIEIRWDKPQQISSFNEVMEVEYDSASLQCTSIMNLTKNCISGYALYKNPSKYLFVKHILPISMTPQY